MEIVIGEKFNFNNNQKLDAIDLKFSIQLAGFDRGV